MTIFAYSRVSTVSQNTSNQKLEIQNAGYSIDYFYEDIGVSGKVFAKQRSEFSKLLNQKAIHKPSAQHVLDDDYYKRIEAIQFTMSHDDGKKVDDINNADVILLGVSRTSKTPTSIYLANRGYKTVNIPLVLDQKIPENLKSNSTACIIGLIADPERLSDIRRNRVAIMKDQKLKEYTDLNAIKKEVEDSKKLFKKNNWPVIDVTRRSVEETAASILKIIDIKRNK